MVTAMKAPHIKYLISALCLLLAGCSDSGQAADGGPAHDGKAKVDKQRFPDAGKLDCKQALKVPTGRLWPVPGEVFYMQVGLEGVSLGEAAVIVGPRGELVLVDVGNDSHDDDVRRAVASLTFNMAKNPGFPKLANDRVDHVILTHYHSDHADGIADMFKHTSVAGKVIHRGFYDVGGAGSNTVGKVCQALAGKKQSLPLCTGSTPAPCSGNWSGTYPASGCPGLDAGDLLKAGDKGRSYLALSGGARINIVAANGRIGQQSYEADVKSIKKDSNGENARSVVALLRHGPFRLLVDGDLTGGGIKTADMEGFYASKLGPFLDNKGVDVLHAAHHGRQTSSSTSWADRLLPIDGRDRTVVMGVSPGHGGSPQAAALNTLLEGQRLAQGRGWTTLVAAAGASHPQLISAKGGHVLVRTMHRGQAYAVQAVDTAGNPISTRVHRSVGVCP